MQDIEQGLNTVEKIIKETIKQKIKFITLFAFSTENWKRPKKEINYLFKLLESFLKIKLMNFIKKILNLKLLVIKIFHPNLNEGY